MSRHSPQLISFMRAPHLAAGLARAALPSRGSRPGIPADAGELGSRRDGRGPSGAGAPSTFPPAGVT